MTLIAQPQSELASQGGFTGALQTSQHYNRGWGFRESKTASFATQNSDQLFMDNLDHLLSRVECLVHFGASSPLFDSVNKRFDRRQGHVGLKQGDTNFARGHVN